MLYGISGRTAYGWLARYRVSRRDPEPWRVILVVGYQAERLDLETGDLTALVVRALVRCAADCGGRGDVSDASDVSDVKKEIRRELILSRSSITRVAKEVAHELETDLDVETLTSRWVGRALQKMRWRSERKNNGRGWMVNLAELRRLTQA